jgi:DNA-binding transcriptional MerR regulator
MNDTHPTPEATQDKLSIGELARLGGVTRRTVRYYVQRGLLPAPEGRGRGSHYTREHLDTLVRIRRLQEKGVPLDGIAYQLDPSAAPPAPPETPMPRIAPWTRVVVDDGVELHLRDQPVDSTQLQALARAIRTILQRGDTP